MPLPTLEKKIEKKVCDYAKSQNILCYKFVSPGNAGVPDRMFILPNGKAFFIEFKREGKQPTPLQKRVGDTIRRHNCNVYVVDSVESGLEVLAVELKHVNA